MGRVGRTQGLFGVVGMERVKDLARQGKLLPRSSGSLGLFEGRVEFKQDGNPTLQLAFKCFHGHRTRDAARTCATKVAKRLAAPS